MWRQLAATVDESLAEPLSEVFAELGALSVSFDDAGDQPLFEPKPGETPLWRHTKVTALFEPETDEVDIQARVVAECGDRLVAWDSTVLADQVWERAWLEHFKPMRFGRRLWVCPTGFQPPEPGAINLRLDPGLAFGTGTHATTALCLEWLEGQDLTGCSVLDYGCGSGILAVAALKLGAAAAVGVDIDPQALVASAENARKNDVDRAFTLYHPDALPAVPAEVVVANILAGPLTELAGDLILRLKPGGSLALSGILAAQVEPVRRAYAAQIEFAPDRFREEWALLSGVRRLE